MSPSRRKLIIAIVAAAVIIFAAYYILVQQYASNAESNPFNYIPSDSGVVAEGDFNSTHVYMFSDNNSSAFILPVTVGDLQLYAQASQNSSSKSIKVNRDMSYLSETIYSIENLNISKFVSSHGGYSSVFSTLVSRPFTTSNGTYFAADIGTAGMTLGNLSAVKASVLAGSSGKTFAGSASHYLSSSSNYSFYIRPGNVSTVSFFTGNVTDGTSSIHANLTNSTHLGTFEISRSSGNLNVTLEVTPWNINLSVTGNYTASQLINYGSKYLKQVGL